MKISERYKIECFKFYLENTAKLLFKAFDLLYKEAWRLEEAAIGNSTLPTVLDKLCMVANINTRKLIELKAEIKIRETKIQALQGMIDSLEQKINEQDRVLCSIKSLQNTGAIRIERYRSPCVEKTFSRTKVKAGFAPVYQRYTTIPH